MQIEKLAIKTIVDEIIAENPTICRMADNLDVLNTDVAVLKGDVAVLKGDVAVLKSDVAVLKSDVAVLKSDVADVKLQGRTNTHAINELFLEQRRQGVMLEDMRSDIKKMLEIVAPSKMREEQFDQMELKVDQHDHRIAALEDALQEHLVENGCQDD